MTYESVKFHTNEKEIEKFISEVKQGGVDEWGIVEYGNDGQCVEYNFCIDNSTGKEINESAFYPLINEDGCWHTDTSHFCHFEVDFSDSNWKEILKEGAIDAYKTLFIQIYAEKNIKFCEISDLNTDQMRLIEDMGWCLFTHQDEGGSYFTKGTSIVNRIGYIVFSAPVNYQVIDSYEELISIAKEDADFRKEVLNTLNPIEDKCYVFLVKDPAKYSFEQVWTNKGLEKAKEIAKTRFRYPHKYYERKDYDKMEKIISQYNTQLAATTEKAKQLLAENGFTVVSANFGVLQNC